MTRPRPGIGSELLPVVLILACLAGTGFLVVSMHRRASAQRKAARTFVQAAPAPIPVRVDPPPAPEPKPEPPAPPAPPPEDPTRPMLARLGTEEAVQILAAQEADRKAVALETARQAAVAESEKWRRREMMARAQLDELDTRARKLEESADMLAMDRDVLANERDAAKAALAKAANRAGSYSILPNKSPNGTWRRPIILECKNGAATLQPKGPTLSLLDLSPLLSPRSSPLINVVVGEMLRTRGLTTPDGSPAVPYIFFVVRPDGILPYYQARARLEALGIAFGYELVDQDMEIEYPDLDNVEEWDGAGSPISSMTTLADVRESSQSTNRSVRTPGGRADPADAFVWPTHPRPSTVGNGGADLPGLDRPPATSGSGSGRGASGTDDGTGRGGAASGRGMGGSSPRLGDGMGRFGPSLVDGQGSGTSQGRGPGQGGSGSGPDPGGGNGSAPFNDPGPFGGPLAGTPGASSVNPPRGTGGGTSAGGASRGLVPLSPDRLPGLEEATALANLDRQGSSGGSEGQSNPGGSGAQAGELGMQGSAESGGSTDVSGAGSGAGSGGSGRTRVGAGQRSGGGGSQGQQSGVPVGLGSVSQGSGSQQGSSSGQPGQSSGFGSSSGGSGERGPMGKSGATDALGRPLKIDAPLEIVVACGPDGVVLHPGGYRISKEVLKSKNSLLAKQLTTIVQLRQQVDPMIRPIPSIRFLVEPMGNDTYREARRQTVLSGVDWPITLQLGDSNILDFVSEERF